MSTHEIVAPEETRRTHVNREQQLYAEALPNPSDRMLFKSLLHEASELHLDWEEALEYVIQKRRHERLNQLRCRNHG